MIVLFVKIFIFFCLSKCFIINFGCFLYCFVFILQIINYFLLPSFEFSYTIIKLFKFQNKGKVFLSEKMSHCKACGICILNRSHHSAILNICITKFNSMYALWYLIWIIFEKKVTFSQEILLPQFGVADWRFIVTLSSHHTYRFIS